MIYFIGNNLFELGNNIKKASYLELKDWLVNKTQVGYDCETTGLDPNSNKLFCYQFGDFENQFVVDNREIPITLFKEELEKLTLIGVSLKFDIKFLLKYNIEPYHIIDLMLNEVNITNGLYEIKEVKGKYNLESLAYNYVNVNLDKSIGSSFSVKDYNEPLYIKEILYSANDVKYLEPILDKQLEVIKNKKLIKVCELENRFITPLAKIEMNGIKLDTNKWTEIKNQVNGENALIHEELNKLILNSDIKNDYIIINRNKKPKKIKFRYKYETINGLKDIVSINWDSPEQVKEICRELKINIEDTQKSTLFSIRAKHPIIELLIKNSDTKSLKSKFTDVLESFINPITNRIHTDYWQILSTGRVSSNKPNLQQIPANGELAPKIRSCFIAKEGYKLVTSDVAGFELRIIAEFSQDPLWLDTFNNNGDLHGIIASKLFNIPIEDVKKPFHYNPNTTYRYIAKQINFMLALN